MTKPKKGKRKKTGRPLTPLDPKVVEGMAQMGGTNAEIGDFMGVDGDTIGLRFSELLRKARANIKLRLRQAQLRAALGVPPQAPIKADPKAGILTDIQGHAGYAGNPTMQIWLGKQMLKQTDESHVLVGDLDKMTDEQLREIAAGKAPKA